MPRWPSVDSRSKSLYERASEVLPGGITRIQPWQDPYPIYADYGEGAYVVDVDGTRRLDLINNFASLIHGHAHPAIVEAVQQRVGRGTAFTLPTESEVALAELLCRRIESAEWVRFSNSGSEAVMSAIKAARALTGRPKIVKIEGAYHGTYDYAEVSLDSAPSNWGNEPRSVPFASGTPVTVTEDVVVIPFNDADAAARIIRAHGDRLAGVLLDATPAYLGFIPIERDFIAAVEEAAREVGALIILDEVISFRLHSGGAQARFGIRPDLTVLAKIIGGGFPIGAVAGPREVMRVFDHRQGKPLLPWSGTFTANPVSMTAGRVSMELLTPDAFNQLERLGERLRQRVTAVVAQLDYPAQITGIGSLFKLHMNRRKITDYRSGYADAGELLSMLALQRALLDHGFLISTRGMGFVSTVITEDEVDAFCDVLGACLARLPRPGEAAA